MSVSAHDPNVILAYGGSTAEYFPMDFCPFYSIGRCRTLIHSKAKTFHVRIKIALLIRK